MNSYGHPQPPGNGYDAGYDAHDSYGAYEDTYAAESYGADPPPTSPTRSMDPYPARPARATAAVGAAPTGRARVMAPESPRPRYDWSGAGAAGVASVPVSPASGPVTGRASVRPGGPGGPAGPAGSGPRGGGGEAKPARKKKRHWLRNSILIAMAVSVIMAGGGMVALSYYVDSVPQPEALALEEASTIFFNNGSEMATLQEVNREIIDTTVPELANARNAVIAAEDKEFYEHSGVDFMGIVRAAWNNATGGTRSGASTIDQQYTRAAADLTEDSYTRKLTEAAMAYKLNQEFTKEEILDFYLNTIYLGRGAYGIEAAADAYFGKDATELTAAEAAVIASVIRLPDDGSGMSPYDPLHNPEDPQIATERWNYVLGQMVEIGALDPAERAELTELPEVVEPPSPDEPLKGKNGHIVKQVTYELEAMGITDLATGGYRITTTIDKDIQKAALEAARRKNKADHWTDLPKNVDAAIVAINPENGAVLGYYGGNDDGTGFDMAGPNWSEEKGWYGGRAPGSSWKIYTLIAEMRLGISFDSHWQTSPYKPDWIDDPNATIQNAGRRAEQTGCEGTAPDFCTLRWATQQSYNTVFAHFSERVPNGEGPEKIVQAAMDAGVTMMQDTQEGVYHDLTAIEDASEVAPKHFFHPVAYGQYPITVLDHANGVATLAARGVYNEAHFVETVEQRVNGEWVPVEGDRISGDQRVAPEHADAITGVLATIPQGTGFALDDGRPAAAKTGTWEYDASDDPSDNLDAWVVGYTPQIATAVWVGDGSDDPQPIKDQFGGNIGSSGLPAVIWKQFMQDAHAAKEFEHAQFPSAPPVGSPQNELANGIEPEPEEPDCRIPFFGCDDDDDDDDRGGGNNGGDDDQGGNQGGILPPPPDGDD